MTDPEGWGTGWWGKGFLSTEHPHKMYARAGLHPAQQYFLLAFGRSWREPSPSTEEGCQRPEASAFSLSSHGIWGRSLNPSCSRDSHRLPGVPTSGFPMDSFRLHPHRREQNRTLQVFLPHLCSVERERSFEPTEGFVSAI